MHLSKIIKELATLFLILKWILGLGLLYIHISSVLEKNQFLKKSFQQHLSKSHYNVNR